MKKLTKERAEKLDGLMDELYRSNTRISIFSEGAGIALNERIELADKLVRDGYAEVLAKPDGAVVYAITTKGRQFCEAGGYLQPFEDAEQAARQKWTDRIVTLISSTVKGFIKGLITGLIVVALLSVI